MKPIFLKHSHIWKKKNQELLLSDFSSSFIQINHWVQILEEFYLALPTPYIFPKKKNIKSSFSRFLYCKQLLQFEF